MSARLAAGPRQDEVNRSPSQRQEAAQLLFISAATVSTHITRIRHKYAAVGRPANRKAVLLARALQDELTTLDDW